MQNDPMRFVIVSFHCNFWGLAALGALVDSARACGVPIHVDVVHNGKSTAQIDHFRSCAAGTDEVATIRHVTAYEGLFQQVDNCADLLTDEGKSALFQHAFVLNWLIKYHLPLGRHFFLDHDALAELPFLGWLSEVSGRFGDHLFVFPRHDREPKSLTAPMFVCDTSIRERLAEFCDLGWMAGIVGYRRDGLRGGAERLYTGCPLERDIQRHYFDDTLHNVVRYLLSRWPRLIDRFALEHWEHLQHVSFGGNRPIDPLQVEVIDAAISDRFDPEYFRLDRGSFVYARFEDHLKKIGLFDKFRAKCLQ